MQAYIIGSFSKRIERDHFHGTWEREGWVSQHNDCSYERADPHAKTSSVYGKLTISSEERVGVSRLSGRRIW